MADEALSPQGRQQADQATSQAMRRRLLVTLAAALVLVGAGWITLWAAGGNPAQAPHAPAAVAANRRASDELLETTKGLQATQQQAVDQLQVVQGQLVAQQAEMKKLAEQVAALTTKLDAMQQSTHAAGPPPKPH